MYILLILPWVSLLQLIWQSINQSIKRYGEKLKWKYKIWGKIKHISESLTNNLLNLTKFNSFAKVLFLKKKKKVYSSVCVCLSGVCCCRCWAVSLRLRLCLCWWTQWTRAVWPETEIRGQQTSPSCWPPIMSSSLPGCCSSARHAGRTNTSPNSSQVTISTFTSLIRSNQQLYWITDLEI